MLAALHRGRRDEGRRAARLRGGDGVEWDDEDDEDDEGEEGEEGGEGEEGEDGSGSEEGEEGWDSDDDEMYVPRGRLVKW